ncbi:MAG: hypothetical protein Q8P81_03625 [Nanoarchaeota archaeon]|nr:hypothetical protein [Nanoarchaeota archaeon]
MTTDFNITNHRSVTLEKEGKQMTKKLSKEEKNIHKLFIYTSLNNKNHLGFILEVRESDGCYIVQWITKKVYIGSIPYGIPLRIL